MAKILIVDDCTDIRDMLANIFELEGYDVLRASDGQEALELFKDNDVGAIVSDLEMPRMSGDKLFEKIWAIQETPMWVYTGSSNNGDLLTSLMLKGVKKCYVKPYDPNELLDAVGTELQREAA